MILSLADATTADHPVGTKAQTLAVLTAAGFAVPGGVVITGATLDRVLAHHGKADAVGDALAALTAENVGDTARRLAVELAGLILPDDVAADLARLLDAHAVYAVRSSGAREDLEGLSFAGQYETLLDIGAADVPHAVIACYRSLFSTTVLTYMLDNGIAPSTTGMSVIVQHMVKADLSGIAFTVNPLTGADTEVVIEVAPGRGDALVAGHVVPERHAYDWYLDREVGVSGAAATPLLAEAMRAEIVDTAVRIQEHCGHPCDIEFAVADGRLFILQSRPITRIGYAGIPDQWTTANFKDGGVSSRVCTPFMWSLYEYIWEIELRRFFLESRLLTERDLRPLGHMFYGRPYWNLTVVKDAVSRVPGYRERQFDNELGVRPTYEGDGQTTSVSPTSLWRVARVALRMRRFTAERRANNSATHAGLIATYARLVARLEAPLTPEELTSTWRHLVDVNYLASEGTYFWQIFINTIQQTVDREQIVAVSGEQGYLPLIGGLEDVSHLRPFYAAWDITRHIRADAADLAFWTGTDADAIAQRLAAGDTAHRLDEVRAFLATYGYHSEREIDVTHPNHAEDPRPVIAMFSDTALLDDSFNPEGNRASLAASYQEQLAAIERSTSPRRYRKLRARIERLRAMLWWREEFKDVSTRYYHLIRLYTLALAGHLASAGVLDAEEDVWFATRGALGEFLDGMIDREQLRALIARNRRYYLSFRAFTNDNEIGATSAAGGGKASAADANATIVGVGGSSGAVTGVARVIAGLDDIGRLQQGDILVTRFTDTGWTSKFALLSGIVTEYGGILCHAAIVSREYDIPCVVCADDATTVIPDGARIRIDGATGAVTLLDTVAPLAAVAPREGAVP